MGRGMSKDEMQAMLSPLSLNITYSLHLYLSLSPHPDLPLFLIIKAVRKFLALMDTGVLCFVVTHDGDPRSFID